MKSSIIALATTLLILAAGCKADHGLGTTSSTPTGVTSSATSSVTASNASTLSPEQLGTLGAQIKKQPSDAHRLLQEQGLTEQAFASAIRKVSEDPAAAKRYAAAYRQSAS
jgi:hypothetical protein